MRKLLNLDFLNNFYFTFRYEYVTTSIFNNNEVVGKCY